MHTDATDITLLHAWQHHRDAEAFHAIVNRHARENVMASSDEQADLLAMVDEAIDALPDDSRCR